MKSVKAPPSGNTITYDDKVKGFGCRVTAAASKSFILNYRTKLGRERRYTIGAFPAWRTKAARDEARRLKARIDQGADPVSEERDARGEPTVADLCDRYLKDYAPSKRPSSRQSDEMAVRLYIKPALGSRKLVEVTNDDIRELHWKIGAKHPIRANRVVALLSKMFNLATTWYQRQLPSGERVPLRSYNPARGIVRNPETKRKRYLSTDELERLTAVLADYHDQQAANVVRLLLMTGARSGEALGMTWAQIDDEGRWTKPGSTTKQKTEHVVPLSAPARQILADIREGQHKGTKFVFPGRGGNDHRVDLKKPWVGICKAANITGLRVHDLRHSYASFLASGGYSLPLIGALLGHTQTQTTQRYTHLLDDPLRQGHRDGWRHCQRCAQG